MSARVNGIGSDTLVNLAGQAVPLVVAVFTIPLLIHGLGTDRFGVLSIAWLVIGYFSVFDLGLGRALTQLIAERLGDRDKEEGLASLVWTALALMLMIGALGGIIAAGFAPSLALRVFKIPTELQAESLTVLYVLAASVPVVVVSSGLIGILAAYRRFRQINAVRIPLGISNFLLPLAILPFSQSLVPVTLMLSASRLLSGLIQFRMCLTCVEGLNEGPRFLRAHLRPLFRFGGWMTVTNIVGPVMVYMDRFLIGAAVSMSAVAYYATPYEMVSRLFIVPAALTMTLFPAFAASHVNAPERIGPLVDSGWKIVFVILFPIVLLLATFAHEGLALWLDHSFADQSASVLQWLAMGVLLNSFAQIVFSLIQGMGRPDLTAKLHLAELLFYLPLLWWALKHFGIVGAAAVWTMRVAVDGGALLWLAARLAKDTCIHMQRIALASLASGLVLGIACLAENLPQRMLVTVAASIGLVATVWRFDFLPQRFRGLLKFRNEAVSK